MGRGPHRLQRLSLQLADDPDLMRDVAEVWAAKLREGDFPWFREFLMRIDPATVVQELTLAGALDSPDLRAALLAGIGTAAAESGNGSAERSGTNGSNGSGV